MLYQTLEYLAEALCYAFFIYQWIIIIAILLTWVTPDPYNPIVQWINRITHPLWNWCYQWLPPSLRFFNAYASLLVVVFLHALIPATLRSINLVLQQMVSYSALPMQIAGHAIQGVGIVTYSLLWFAIIILAVWFIMTLVSPSPNNPLVRVAYTLADPIISPIQRYLPRTQVDLSPLVGILIFYLISSYLLAPFIGYGAMLSAPVHICV
ncbi:MAG: YggT family protein [SAR324 cluster bacterium]|nr:YggT family protein [SAR324 cluster bacterium]